jgi:hypothetical protein
MQLFPVIQEMYMEGSWKVTTLEVKHAQERKNRDQ